MKKMELMLKVRRHIAKAKKAGKCVQCQHPWHDGICSCGKWGTVEQEMQRIAIKNRFVGVVLMDGLKQEIKREVRRIDANLKSVKELGKVWQWNSN